MNKEKLFRQVLIRMEQYDFQSIARAAQVSPQTPWNWYYGYVTLPQDKTLNSVARVIGL